MYNNSMKQKNKPPKKINFLWGFCFELTNIFDSKTETHFVPFLFTGIATNKVRKAVIGIFHHSNIVRITMKANIIRCCVQETELVCNFVWSVTFVQKPLECRSNYIHFFFLLVWLLIDVAMCLMHSKDKSIWPKNKIPTIFFWLGSSIVGFFGFYDLFSPSTPEELRLCISKETTPSHCITGLSLRI